MDREAMIKELLKYSDTKWLAHAQKIGAEAAAPTQKRGRPRKEQPPPVSIDEVIAQVRAPFTIIKEDDKVTKDGSTIKIACGLQHVHRYFICDIAALKCKTCSFRGKYIANVRIVAESLLRAPFILADIPTRGRPRACEFINEKHNLVIECCKLGTAPLAPEIIGGKLVISMVPTGKKKIATEMVNQLYSRKDWFSADIQEIIVAALPTPPVHKVPFQAGPIPYSNDFADIILTTCRVNDPDIVKQQMNIVTDTKLLCIENCKN